MEGKPLRPPDVETAGSEVPLDRRWQEKNTTWLPPGTTATVRFLRGSDRLRHASIKDLRIGSRLV